MQEIAFILNFASYQVMHKLDFKIVEIPDGASERSLGLAEEDLDLDEYGFEGGQIDLSFFKTPQFIRVNFTIDVDVELICDRSLDPFTHSIEDDYEVVFKVEVEEEREDEEGAVRRFDFSSNMFSIKDEVRDTILLNIPIKKLHPKFIDEEGKTKDYETKKFGDVDTYSNEESIDPRWEKLKKLKNN